MGKEIKLHLFIGTVEVSLGSDGACSKVIIKESVILMQPM